MSITIINHHKFKIQILSSHKSQSHNKMIFKSETQNKNKDCILLTANAGLVGQLIMKLELIITNVKL